MLTDQIVEAVLTVLAFMRAIMDAALASLSGLVQAHPVLTEVLVVIAIIVLVTLGYISINKRRLRNFNIFRGRHMTKEERELVVAVMVADKVSEAIDDLVLAGRMTTWEATKYFNRLGHVYGLALCDLRRPKLRLSPEQREHLRNSMKTKFKTEKISTKPNIPGPKPGEGVPTVRKTSISKAGGWAERFRGRLKSA